MRALSAIGHIVSVWGFLCIIAIVLDALGWLPYYDIYYKKKTDIEPLLFLYPGQHIRLSADFARDVEPKDIESITWILSDSAGNKFTDLPHLRDIDLTLLPDFSGTVNVKVIARLFQENYEQSGSASIYIVQTRPHELSFEEEAEVILPADTMSLDLNSVQVYKGNATWQSASATVEDTGTIHLSAEGQSFPLWNGKAYLRFKQYGMTAEGYEYETATAIDENTFKTPAID